MARSMKPTPKPVTPARVSSSNVVKPSSKETYKELPRAQDPQNPGRPVRPGAKETGPTRGPAGGPVPKPTKRDR